MCLLIGVLILFGSFTNSLSSEKCRFDRIYNEVIRFCRGSDYCNSELNNFITFLKFFLVRTELFCNLPRLKGYCQPCSLNASSWNDLIAGQGNATSATGSGTTATGNGTSISGNGTSINGN